MISLLGASLKETFRGDVEGEILRQMRGEGGFGYDPLFIPKGHQKSFGEIPDLKLQISHRNKALKACFKHLKEIK